VLTTEIMVIKVCVNEPCNKVSTHKHLINFLFSMVSKEEFVSPLLFNCVLQTVFFSSA